ncbi:MAG: putative photosynthetic complex assembly protein PuhE [Chromatocurvus sp.]
MSSYLLAVSVALLGWWVSTGIILYLNLLPSRSHAWSVGGFAVFALASLAALPYVAEQHSQAAAIAGFAIALAVWGALEISYLMGFLTGNNSQPCPASVSGWRRFRLAVATSIHHEIAVIACGIAIVVLSWGATNQVAAGTYLTLWLMRWSAKLNLYLGVSNFNEHWLPERNRYLVSYMRTRAMNWLFPFSVGLATIAAVLLALAASGADNAVDKLSFALVCTLLSLAILEHWFLVLPVRDSALWQWAITAAGRVRARTTQRTTARVPPAKKMAITANNPATTTSGQTMRSSFFTRLKADSSP